MCPIGSGVQVNDNFQKKHPGSLLRKQKGWCYDQGVLSGGRLTPYRPNQPTMRTVKNGNMSVSVGKASRAVFNDARLSPHNVVLDIQDGGTAQHAATKDSQQT